MKRLIIVLVALIVVLILTGCKVKEDKIIKDMEKAAKEMNIPLDNADMKTEQSDNKVTDEGSNKGDTSVNKWLDGFEDIVATYEKKAGKKALTAKDMVDINIKLGELSQKTNDSRSWLPTQAERLRKLSARLNAIIQQFKR